VRQTRTVFDSCGSGVASVPLIDPSEFARVVPGCEKAWILRILQGCHTHWRRRWGFDPPHEVLNLREQ